MQKDNEKEYYQLNRYPDNYVLMQGVTEYTEGMPVYLAKNNGLYPISHNTKKIRIGNNRFIVLSLNEGGYNGTEIDLEQLLEWVANNLPSVYIKFLPESK